MSAEGQKGDARNTLKRRPEAVRPREALRHEAPRLGARANPLPQLAPAQRERAPALSTLNVALDFSRGNGTLGPAKSIATSCFHSTISRGAYMLRTLLALCAIACLSGLPQKSALAQPYYRSAPPRYVPPPQPRSSRGEILGRGVEEGYNQYQQYQDQQQWPDRQRQMWEADQQQKQRWLQEQEARRYRQQQPQFVPPHANSTPQYYAPSQNYDQNSDAWRRQHQGRQEMLNRMNRQPLPPW